MNSHKAPFTDERQDGNEHLQALGVLLNSLPVLSYGMSAVSGVGTLSGKSVSKYSCRRFGTLKVFRF